MRNFQRLLLLGFFGIFLLNSCQEDEKPIDNSSQVIGYWLKVSNVDNNLQVLDSYSFTEAGTYARITSYIDSAANESKGYGGRETGTYTLLNDQLVTQSNEIYRVPESANKPYAPIGSLVLITENYSRDVTVEFKEDKMTWIFPPCGPLENCIGSQVFERYTPLEF